MLVLLTPLVLMVGMENGVGRQKNVRPAFQGKMVVGDKFQGRFSREPLSI